MAKAKTNKKAADKKKPAAKPVTAKKPVKVAAKPAPKPVLKELKEGHVMTEKKLRTITDKKGLSRFLMKFKFDDFIGMERTELDDHTQSRGAPQGYEFDEAVYKPFAIKKTDLVVLVEVEFFKPQADPVPTPEPEPDITPTDTVPVTGGEATEPPKPNGDPTDNGADRRFDDTELAPAEKKAEGASLEEYEPVAAEVHSDDREATATFDAQEWFKQAADDDILELAREGYQFDATSDAVAEFMKDKDEKVKEVFDYVDSKNATLKSRGKDNEGFGCSVDESQALDWVEKFRPHLMDKLAKIKDGEEETEEKGEVVTTGSLPE